VAGDLTSFATEVWGRRPLLSRAGELPAAGGLFSPEAVDELVADRGLRTPFLRVAKNGMTLGDREFTSGGGVGATVTDQLSDDKLLRLFADGATMVLQGLHRTWGPLVTFSQQLAAELGHPVQVNAYVTPAQSQGFSDHYDVHDVFVLQVQGEKRWMVRPPVHPSPLRDHAWTDRRADVERAARAEPMLDVVLRPGDVLYLPRGFLHAAKALGGVSTHLTVGIHTWTRYSLAEQLLAEALAVVAEDPEVRASLPLGADVSDGSSVSAAVHDVRAALVRAMDGVTPETVAARMGRAASSAQRAAPVHPLAQLSAAESLDRSTVVRLRSHLRARLERRGKADVVISRAGQVRLDDDAQTRCLAELLDGDAVSVGELVDRHGEVQPLVRRLLLAGVLVAR